MSLRLYFYVDFLTAALITWSLAWSFRTQPLERYVILFRIGLFIFFNAQVVILTAGLKLITTNNAILTVSLLLIPAMGLIIVSFNDFVRFINRSYKSAVDLSLTDELTGLPNRRCLNLTLREFDKKAGTICVIDIDHFKKINDRFGHETGDKVLIAVGLILSEFIDDNVFVARTGGEEFCVIISGHGDSVDTIGKLKDALTFDYSAKIAITISIGVGYKRRNENFTTAMISADEALYHAKRSGRDCIVFSNQL